MNFETKEGTVAAIIAECRKQGLRLPAQIAYVMATVEHETAGTFQPVREAYWKSEGWRKRNLRYYPYYGRGFVQLTWKTNYQKYEAITGKPLEKKPDLAMDPETSCFILVHGFKEGAFTGHGMAGYVNEHKRDFVRARKCINGMDRAEHIAGLADQWLHKLEKEKETES